MAISFWVRNNAVVDTEIDDLGSILSGSQELDLYSISDIYSVNQSATNGDLALLEAANTVDFLDGPGGSIVPATEIPVFSVSQDQIDTISASGITENQHRQLDQLVHNIAENSYTQLVYSGNKITDEIIWTTSGMTLKIRESNFTYTGNKVNQEICKQYNGAGSLVETSTKTYSYSGNSVVNITEVIT